MTSTHASATQSQSSTSKSPASVQRSAAGGLRAQARGMDFAQAESMYAPIQKKGVQRDAKAAESQMLAQDLGEVATIPSFSTQMGGSLQAYLPTVGNSVGVSMKGMLAASPFIGKIGFDGEAARNTTGFEVKGKLTLDLGIGAIGTGFEASVTIQAALELAGKADSIDECMRIALIPVYQYLHKYGFNGMVDGTTYLFTGKSVCELLFGETYLEALLATMDPEGSGEETDTLTSTATIGLAGTAKASAGEGLGAGVNAGVAYKHESTVTKDEDGALKQASEHKFEASMAVNVGPVTGAVKVSKGEKLTVDLELECSLEGLGNVLATYAMTVWDQVAAVLNKSADKADGESATIKRLIEGELRSVALTSLSGWFATFAHTPEGKLAGAVAEYAIKGAFTFEDGTFTRAKLTSESKQGLKKSIGAGGGIGVEAELKSGSVLMDRAF